MEIRRTNRALYLVLRSTELNNNDSNIYNLLDPRNNNDRNHNYSRNNYDMGHNNRIHNVNDDLYYYCSRNDCPCSDIYVFDIDHSYNPAMGSTSNNDIND